MNITTEYIIATYAGRALATEAALVEAQKRIEELEARIAELEGETSDDKPQRQGQP